MPSLRQATEALADFLTGRRVIEWGICGLLDQILSVNPLQIQLDPSSETFIILTKNRMKRVYFMPYPNPRKTAAQEAIEAKKSPNKESSHLADKTPPVKTKDSKTEDVLRQNPHYLLAKEAECLVQERFPYGAINQVAVATRLGVGEEELMKLLSIFPAHEHYSSEFNINRMADIAQTVLFANCGFLTYYALGYLKKKHPDVLVEAMNLENHNLLLLGRKPGSDPMDITTWGRDALICDLWASQYYLASDFLKRRASQQHIPYYALLGNHFTLQDTGIEKVVDEHYLDGNPRAFEGRAYDEKIADWVAEDQRRWELPLKTSPNTPSSVITLLDRDKVKSALAKLARYDNWKFNQAQGVAFCECSDEKRIARIADTLMATKAMVVTVTRRSDNRMPVVKCECIEFNVIQRLAEASHRKSVYECMLELQLAVENQRTELLNISGKI